MENPFNLTKCKKLSERHRTIGGVTYYYHTYYEPRGLNKNDRVTSIHAFKHPRSPLEKALSNEMIDYSVGEFLKVHNIQDFDYIIGIPSSSKIIKQIIDKLSSSNFKGQSIYRGFKKTRVRNIKLKKEVIDGEGSIWTKNEVPKSFKRTRELHYDKVSKVSFFKTSYRRYLENILTLNLSNPQSLQGKRVLVVDDTFGEGLTMCEVFRILKPYTINVIGFTVMKDTSQKRKKKM
jgi:hypothetical protein